MRETSEKLSIECKLTNEEMLALGQKLVTISNEIENILFVAKDVVKQHKSKILEKKSEIRKVLKCIEIGKELCEIECSITYDWDKKNKIWHRVDTGEIVKEEPITAEKMQENIFENNNTDDEEVNVDEQETDDDHIVETHESSGAVVVKMDELRNAAKIITKKYGKRPKSMTR